jgi:hypothetical protein
MTAEKKLTTEHTGKDRIFLLRSPELASEFKQTMSGKGDEKSLTLRHLKYIHYELPAEERSTQPASLPSGEYRSEQSRHVRFFQRLCPGFYATTGKS